ncbi:39S ribosomal protein L21, mitochondrial [Balamuthia mandrillaris]
MQARSAAEGQRWLWSSAQGFLATATTRATSFSSGGSRRAVVVPFPSSCTSRLGGLPWGFPAAALDQRRSYAPRHLPQFTPLTFVEERSEVPRERPPSQPLPDSFAVVYIAGKQFKVTKGDVVVLPSPVQAEVSSQIILKKVLLVATKDFTAVGRPLVTRAFVEATVEEQTKTQKVLIFKKKRRKRTQRTKGHRQPVSVLRIGDIRLYQTEGEAFDTAVSEHVQQQRLQNTSALPSLLSASSLSPQA